MKDYELQLIVKGCGVKIFKKWLDELIILFFECFVVEIGILYFGSVDWVKEMKESL